MKKTLALATVLFLANTGLSFAGCLIMKNTDAVGKTSFICTGTHNDGSPCTKTLVSNSECVLNKTPCFTCN